MADDSLIEEMRRTIRGDRERAEQRRTRDLRSAPTVDAASPPAEAPPDQVRQPADPEPEVASRVDWLRWFRRRPHR